MRDRSLRDAAVRQASSTRLPPLRQAILLTAAPFRPTGSILPILMIDDALSVAINPGAGVLGKAPCVTQETVDVLRHSCRILQDRSSSSLRGMMEGEGEGR